MVSRYKGDAPYPFKIVNKRTARQIQEHYEETASATPDYMVDTVNAELTTLDGTSMILLETTGERAGEPFATISLLGPRGNARYTLTVEGEPDGAAAARKAVVDSWTWQ
jgi:hypothetical protein